MVGGRSGTALKGQTSFSPAPRSVAAPVAVIIKRCCSVPAGNRAASSDAVTPPLAESSNLTWPIARTTRIEFTGTLIGPPLCIDAAVVSPGCRPGRMIGGLPV